ncbi:C1 family peptidase [uncultured Limosilactobacillus sp.]|uniref:C1 family peptidase n=1 Tax=uncultured Limosilactobacillus sp. TaxID=2837629 RepID=UPI0025E496D0|nr:C1 family peptidase [uncultured Limosilactobacillus sp.]
MSKDTIITNEMVNKFHDNYVSRGTAKVIERAVRKNGIKATSEDPEINQRLHRVFNHEIKTGKVSNQKHSGRCWSFATLNTLRHQFALANNFKDFELSQNYLFFWDRIERANKFFTNILATADRDLTDRLVDYYLKSAESDGGQWANAASIIEKYGVVPHYVMPDTFNTEDTTDIAEVLTYMMKKDALILRKLAHQRASEEEIQATRQRMLSDVYRACAYAFGEPPVKFDLEFRDDDQQYHRAAALTPLEFYHQYFKTDLHNYVVVTNAPDHEYYKLYSLPAQDNVIGGIPIQFVNVPFEKLQEVVMKQLDHNETIWVGNDILQQMDRKRGLMDAQLYHREELLGIDFTMSKKARLATHQAEVTHAMTLTGYNLVDGQPNRWKIENSWGDKNGDQGYFVMSQNWFEQYTYEAVINKKYLTAEIKQIAKQTPIELTAWDSLQ